MGLRRGGPACVVHDRYQAPRRRRANPGRKHTLAQDRGQTAWPDKRAAQTRALRAAARTVGGAPGEVEVGPLRMAVLVEIFLHAKVPTVLLVPLDLIVGKDKCWAVARVHGVGGDLAEDVHLDKDLAAAEQNAMLGLLALRPRARTAARRARARGEGWGRGWGSRRGARPLK